MNPYADFVSQAARLIRDGRRLPLGGFPMPACPTPAPDAPRVLIFSPHPDDEVIVGGLAVRLMREAGWRAVNVAVTQGSSKARQSGRWEELQACCRYIGFELVQTASGGLEKITTAARADDPAGWSRSVQRIARILEEQAPKVILFPHDDDWNGTHIGTHYLVVDALRSLGPEFTTVTVETEFWGAMDTPNLMVELAERDVADMIAALSFHAGEVQRNPYHLSMPAWLMDNVRRGGELVGGQGGAAPEFVFGTLYRLRRWQGGNFQPVQNRGRFVSAADDPAAVLGF